MQQIGQAIHEYREAGMPLAGALRLAALHVNLGEPRNLAALFAAALQGHGHRPEWGSLRALVAASERLTPRMLSPHALVCQAGHPPNGLYVVHQGEVERGDGVRLGPMAVVGFAEAACGQPYQHTVRAVGPAVLLHLSQADTLSLFAGCPVAERAFTVGPRAVRPSAPPVGVRRVSAATAPPRTAPPR